MNKPYSIHPQWRENFKFTTSYSSTTPTYTVDPIMSQSKANVEFVKDPTVHYYTAPEILHYSYPD